MNSDYCKLLRIKQAVSVEGDNLTICIAAIGKEDGKEVIVFATDHMISTGVGRFEHPIVKYREINKNTVAMLAGNPSIFDELIKIEKAASYTKIKHKIFENFKESRWKNLQAQVLDKYGLDKKFVIDSLEKPIQNPYMDSILETIAKPRLNTGILLIGFDDGKAQISEITESGFEDIGRVLNFHAIGSGSPQATNTLLFQKHDKKNNLLTTIYNVYKAKRNAEVMEGVGKDTDLVILTENGSSKIDKTKLEKLEKIYEEELCFGKTHQTLQELNIRLG